MDISFASLPSGPLPEHSRDIAAAFVIKHEEDRSAMARITGAAALLSLAPWLEGHPALADCKGDAATTTLLYGPSSADGAPRLALAGLGKGLAPDADHWKSLQTIRHAMAALLVACRSARAEAVHFPLAALEDVAQQFDLELQMVVEEAVVGALTGVYAFTKLKSKTGENGDNGNNDTPIPNVKLLVEDAIPGPGSALHTALARGLAGAAGVWLARDLCNAPANHATPAYLQDVAEDIAETYDFELEVFTAGELMEMGMGAFGAVFQADPSHARFLVMDTHGNNDGPAQAPLVLVGKGVTFDSGGLSLKPPASQETMKCDMAGAAAILGCMRALGELETSQRVVALIPATDNMPGAKAVRPGDVVKSYSGKTIEILNTDAEGRLLLCDAIAYAARFKPAAIVDVATLTGAAVVALGDHVAAIYGTHPLLVAAIQRLAMPVGDYLWPMPNWDFYFDELKSDIADMKNVGTRMGGSIHAAQFLKQFVPEGTPWAHLDIAGPAYKTKAAPDSPAGGTGFATRTLLHLALAWEELGIAE